MIDARHMYGSIGASCGAALPLLASLLVIPPLVCSTLRCPSPSDGIGDRNVHQVGESMLSLARSPYIDNARDEYPGCRPQGAPDPPPASLTRYSFPRSFTPAYFRRPVFACILVGGDGTIIAVRLPQRLRGGARDRELVDTIRRAWGFADLGSPRASWQRVRLNDGPFVSPPIIYYL